MRPELGLTQPRGGDVGGTSCALGLKSLNPDWTAPNCGARRARGSRGCIRGDWGCAWGTRGVFGGLGLAVPADPAPRSPRQVGVLQYGEHAVHEWTLGQHRTAEEVVEAARNISRQEGRETRTAFAIHQAWWGPGPGRGRDQDGDPPPAPAHASHPVWQHRSLQPRAGRPGGRHQADDRGDGRRVARRGRAARGAGGVRAAQHHALRHRREPPASVSPPRPRCPAAGRDPLPSSSSSSPRWGQDAAPG